MKYIFRVVFLIIIFLSGCSRKEVVLATHNQISNNYNHSYVIKNTRYFPKKKVYVGWTQKGIASWYGSNFHGRKTSNGEIYNMYAYTAAHKTLPMNTIVKVTNLNNHKSVVVRINDRGPFVNGRIIDLSYAAAKKIGMDKIGTAPVKIEVISLGNKKKRSLNKYVIQIGAFRSYKSAKIFAEKYKNLGYNIKIKKINGLYKVFISGFSNYKEAMQFKRVKNIEGFIVGD
jgi:rare lipoprotein A